MENNHRVDFSEKWTLYKVRLFDEVSELTVESCFDAYEKLVAQHFDRKPFKLMINNSGYRPTTERAHSLIRHLFSNQTHKTKCIKVAIVNECIPAIEKRKELGVMGIEGFFSNEKDALEWLEIEM